MIEWLRCRRVGWCALIAITLGVVSGLVTGRLPSLFLLYSTSDGAPVRLVLPALAATAILTPAISPIPRADFASASTAHKDLLLVAALAAATIAATGLASLLTPEPAAGVFARNLLGFLGIGLLGRIALPTGIAALTPIAWMIPTLTLGRPDGDVLSWPLIPSVTDPRAAIIAIGLLLTGTTVEWIRAQRQPHRPW